LNGSAAPPVPTPQDLIATDAIVVGAGPVGLFQVFELGLLDIRAHVIDALPYAGGQCIELYPDKPIYDIPAVQVCTGRELTDRLLKQIAPFHASFHFEQVVTEVERQDDGRFRVRTSRGTGFLAKTIFIAAGVGAFLPRMLKVEGLESFEGTQLFYRVHDPADFASKKLVIVGEDDAALDWAIEFAKSSPHKAKGVTLIHRRDGFKAAPEIVAQMRALCAVKKMAFIVGQVTGYEAADGQLRSLKITEPDGAVRDIALDALLVLLGQSPKLGPVADWGLALERKQLKVNTENFSTSEPGIFAVGDVNTYPGKKKLLVSGFHECALAAYGAAAIVFPDKPIHLQYTTTSPALHQRLGVGTLNSCD
jgi:thioredoxin reductase (NADPH)